MAVLPGLPLELLLLSQSAPAAGRRGRGNRMERGARIPAPPPRAARRRGIQRRRADRPAGAGAGRCTKRRPWVTASACTAPAFTRAVSPRFCRWSIGSASTPRRRSTAAYERITGVRGSGNAALESARALLASGVDCEFRTTWHAGFLSPAELERLAQTLADLGVRRYALQEFRASGCLAFRPEGAPVAADLDASGAALRAVQPAARIASLAGFARAGLAAGRLAVGVGHAGAFRQCRHLVA